MSPNVDVLILMMMRRLSTFDKLLNRVSSIPELQASTRIDLVLVVQLMRIDVFMCSILALSHREGTRYDPVEIACT